jgi:hypothetical protein
MTKDEPSNPQPQQSEPAPDYPKLTGEQADRVAREVGLYFRALRFVEEVRRKGSEPDWPEIK